MNRRFAQSLQFGIAYTWDIQGASRWWNTPVVRAALDGWQLAGVTAFASGYPFTPSFSTADGQDIWGGVTPVGSDGAAIRIRRAAIRRSSR